MCIRDSHDDDARALPPASSDPDLARAARPVASRADTCTSIRTNSDHLRKSANLRHVPAHDRPPPSRARASAPPRRARRARSPSDARPPPRAFASPRSSRPRLSLTPRARVCGANPGDSGDRARPTDFFGMRNHSFPSARGRARGRHTTRRRGREIRSDAERRHRSTSRARGRWKRGARARGDGRFTGAAGDGLRARGTSAVGVARCVIR